MDPRERGARRVKDKERQALLDRAYQRVVGNNLDKFTKKKVTTGTYNVHYCTALPFLPHHHTISHSLYKRRRMRLMKNAQFSFSFLPFHAMR